jgi:hypothetical protein
MKPRPAGKGLGRCPYPSEWGGRPRCGCNDPCAACGYPKHSGVHMHCYGEKEGDPPFDHEYVSKRAASQEGGHG